MTFMYHSINLSDLYTMIFFCLFAYEVFLKDLYRAKNKYLCFLYNSVLAMVRVFSHQIAIVAITCARFGDYSRRSLVLGPHTLKVPSSDPETSTFG